MKCPWLLLVFSGKLLLAQVSLPQSTTHVVNLSWQAGIPNGDPEVGFFVYRELVGNSGFSKINETPVVPTSYTDTNLLYGVSYEYYVTAVDANGNESPSSNMVTVPIPFVPYTPVIGTITTGS